MIRTVVLAVLLAVSSYDTLRIEAERYYEEKSFSRAHALYEEAAKLELSPGDRRWVRMRLADTQWRAGDDRDSAQKALADLIRESASQDRVWAEANESLGELTGDHQYLLAALDYWAGSDDIALARKRYLAIVFRMTPNDYFWGIPQEVLANAVTIAETPQDRAHARYLLASQLLQQGNVDAIARGLDLLDEIIAIGNKTEWYDDALYRLASHLEQRTDPRVASAYEQASGADIVKALRLYERLAQLPGSRYRDDAQNAIHRITEARLDISVAGTFLPDSEQEVVLSWRNVENVALSIHAVDLTKDTDLPRNGNWIEATRIGPPLRSWTFPTNDDGMHRPGFERVRLEPRLPRGAYIVVAEARGQRARTLVLVSETNILAHAAGERIDVFVSDVRTGEPLSGARVRLDQQVRDRIVTKNAVTDANGLATLTVPEAAGTSLITAAAGDRQAYLQTYASRYRGERAAQWRIYAFTDRPAYRPGETVRWKIIARTREDDRYATPAGESLAYDIINNRGEKVANGTAKLNAFGSYSAELPLDASMLLGIYTIRFRSGDNERGSAQLFRLEEYKLPEFRVDVQTPPDRQYRLGETIEATIEASYYFGGAVSNAEVELVVYAQPFVRWWAPWHVYGWMYEQDRGYDAGTIVKRETLHTDANGRATVRIVTPREGTDMTYRIEARVVDASRREVRGSGSVRVTRQRYTVMLMPEHFVHRPGDSISIDIKAVDANDRPVQTSGSIAVDGGTPVRVKTDEKGAATFTFTPKREGHYVIRFTSDDAVARDVVTAETTVWVASAATRDLGYRSTGGIDIILDKDTMLSGQTASVLLVTPASGRWVLLTTTADGILDTRVVHLDGTVKLVQWPIDDRHTPNFFVTATTIFDRRLSTDTERIVVPPVAHFLNIDVKSDRDEYRPREEGTVTITTRDHTGKPVSAEVALAVSDEAVTAIQEDLAGDPRAFFFGEMRGQALMVTASVTSQRYVKLEETKPEEPRKEENEFAAERRVGGAIASDAMMPAPPPAPPPAPVAQSIAVTGAAAAVEAATIDVKVRSDFRSTAFWKPDVITDANGTATVKVTYPEALTTWRATARAVTEGTQFGMASSTTKTNMPLIVRLQAPRFFVAGDRSTVSAVLNNNTGESITVEPSIAVEGLRLERGDAQPVQVAAHGEARVDWTVFAEREGTAKITMTGRSAKYADAMEKTYTVYEHGIDKLVARGGKLRGGEAIVRLDLPKERRATELTVQIAPSLAVTMLDALPYLIDYPYGCTEQTMSRFLPAAIVARTLEKLHLGRARIAGKPLDDVTRASMTRLYDMQHGNGAWGWWKESADDAFMTAYVVWGFALARDAGLDVREDAIEEAVRWLRSELAESEGDWNEEAWILHALSAWDANPAGAEVRAFEDAYAHRDRLTSYSRALLALTAHRYEDERAAVLVRNLENGAKIDRTPDQSVLLKGDTAAETMATAHWGNDGFWWRWYEGPVETTAFVLQALVTIDPKNALIEPAMNWLVKNRRGTRWSNTRDTAIALLALDDYLVASGELRGDVAYELTVNGRIIASKTLTAADVLGAPSRFSIDPDVLTDTRQEIHIRRTGGTAPIYFSAEARFVSLDEPVKAAGNEIFVKREYFRLSPRPTLLKGLLYDRVPLRDGDSIASGERVEVQVTIETKNDYEYLLFEDLKPAGLEAVELQSGTALFATSERGNQFVYQELRDRKVALFADRLAQGLWTIRYTLRAETPGTFHALPVIGGAMYAPDVRANGDEVRLTVQ